MNTQKIKNALLEFSRSEGIEAMMDLILDSMSPEAIKELQFQLDGVETK